ncbi:arylsulfatase [Lentisphaera profundi]|uniref:Arylsulfatase n=1 Tax=Lentisphaera profundi TaxID=1658616 RepID=A0ABY7W059_9BACT|nr:arylsulfatase [Lentisphaera profundi]WDE98924.1 arylsulfatase [Lentisphaera profundi]
MIYTRIMALLLIVTTVSATELDTSKSPNILLVLVDDMGYSDLGCYGGEINTPTIDSLASKGLRYSQFYNSARCTPTRAAILSGYYAQQINRDSVLDLKGKGVRPKWARLLPKYLKPAGYRSYHSGKWHIDGKPMGNGFDRSLYIDNHGEFSPKVLLKNGKRIEPKDGFYATIAVADHAIEVLKEHQAHHADKPFFSYVAFTAPHFPLQALPEDIARVGDRYKVGWDVIRNQRWEGLQKRGLIKGSLSKVEYNQGPPLDFSEQLKVLGEGEVTRPIPWNDLTEKQKEFQQVKMTIHAAMIERIDIELARIIKQVKAMNSFEDTVIFFLSDNGASAEMMVRGNGHDPEAAPGSAGSYLCLGPAWSTVANTPFRKHKIWAHEGGSCTPFIVHWPKHISQSGAIRETSGHVIDLVPTILDLAGLKMAKQRVPFPGKSLLPSFRKDTEDDRVLWWSHRGNHAVRNGNWKLVKSKDGSWELYDLKEDRAETNDLAAQYPEKVKALTKQWEAQVEQIRQIKKLK